MNNRIFGIEAPKYWARNLPVVPVEGKAPIIAGWPGLLGAIPKADKQAAWCEEHSTKNIGLLLGPELGAAGILTGIDIDDDSLLNLVLSVLGLNRKNRRAVLSGKKGKKGATIFARAERGTKSTVIKGTAGLGNIDFLSSGKQTVMPPSIHPATGQPYKVYGEALLTADFQGLPEISDHQIRLLKATIGSEHAKVLVDGSSTHDAGVALSAILVASGATDDEIQAIFEGLLPTSYEGNTLKELPEWVRSAREKGFDDVVGGATNLTQQLVNLALVDGVTLFNDGDGSAFVTLPQTGQAIAYRVRSEAFKQYLRYQAYTGLGKAVSITPLSEAVATVETIALFDGRKIPTFVRVAGGEGEVVIDLGTDDGRVIRVVRDGWSIENGGRHRFVRGAGFESLPLPAGNGGLAKLKVFLSLDDQNYRLLVAYLISALRPQGPYFILLVEGEQGSGKSFFCEVVKRILDPNRASRLRLPDNPQDLMIQAKEYRLLAFDNASGMKADMSDALCTLATGGGIAVRKLYSDGDLYVMTYTRPFIINGISGYASRPDLMERAIPIRLSPMQVGERKTEAELLEELAMFLPSILADLYDAVAKALELMPTVEPPRHIRMADAATWVKAAEPALGLEGGSLIDAIALAQDEFVVEKINEDPLVNTLRSVCQAGPFEDYVNELFVQLRESRGPIPENMLPKTPAHLSNQLKRLRPALAKAGVHVEILDRDNKGRKIRVWTDGPSKVKF